MPIVLGTDLGTTTITALALDTASGDVLACSTRPNQAEITSPADRAAGRSEWDVRALAATACDCLRSVAEQLQTRLGEIAGLGITGQQHGFVLVDPTLTPLTPFITWQDRRGEEIGPDGKTCVQQALTRVGENAPRRTGCRLATGYMAVTLFWMKEKGLLPKTATACFVMDYFGALLTGQKPVTDATCAASSGVLDVARRDWDADLLAALGLPRPLFPEVRPSGERLGSLAPALAEQTALPAGLTVFGGIGDNQASFLGSVGDHLGAVLVNVGTGGQVAAYSSLFACPIHLETRPFPGQGYLLVCAGLCGGRSYAVLEHFFREVGGQLFNAPSGQPLYQAMNRLAEQVPSGCEGLRCEPFFTGTRAQPQLRATWSGVSATNFTPAHLTRALLEGMARAFREGYQAIQQGAPVPCNHLIGAGNGLRENRLLTQLVGEAFDLPLALPRHREEAAYGAALLASVGAGVYPDLDAAGRLIRYGN